MLAFSEFARLAQQGNYVPVTLTLTADLETPVSILSRLKDDENVFLLESVEAGERFGRTIDRVGVDKFIEMLLSDDVLSRKKEILSEPKHTAGGATC